MSAQLRRFEFGNHESFRDRQELGLVPESPATATAVPVAVLHGPTAAGKSAALRALDFLVERIRCTEMQWSHRPAATTPFAFTDRARNAPSGYLVDLDIDGLRHVYHLRLAGRAVVEESLHTGSAGSEALIFARVGDQIELGAAVAAATDRRALRKTRTRADALLLRVAARRRIPAAESVAEWLADAVHVVDLDDLLLPEPLEYLDLRADDPAGAELLAVLLRAADLGVDGITVPRDRGPDVLHLLHGPVPVPITEESSGTRAWLGIAWVLVTLLAEGGVLLLDWSQRPSASAADRPPDRRLRIRDHQSPPGAAHPGRPGHLPAHTPGAAPTQA